ncbi:unnamed protein product [Prorocentrum cordatum]|nr:unnamed protein product [Polarella glacialis]
MALCRWVYVHHLSRQAAGTQSARRAASPAESVEEKAEKTEEEEEGERGSAWMKCVSFWAQASCTSSEVQAALFCSPSSSKAWSPLLLCSEGWGVFRLDGARRRSAQLHAPKDLQR